MPHPRNSSIYDHDRTSLPKVRKNVWRRAVCLTGCDNLPSSPFVDTSSQLLRHIDNGTYAVDQAQMYIYTRGSRQHYYRRPLLNVSFSFE